MLFENYTHTLSTHTAIVPLWICQCGFQTCPPSHSFGPAIRDHILIHYITKGKGTFTNQYGTYSLSAHQGFLIMPDEVTVYTADADDPWEYYWIGFKGSYASDLLTKSGLCSTAPTFTYPSPDLASKYLLQMLQASTDYQSSEMNRIGLLYLFLAPLVEFASATPPSGKALTQQYFEHAIKYVEDNFSYDMTVIGLARMIGIDRTYLYKIFKQECSLSPEQYILHFRLKKACDFLKTTSYTISQIAFSTGFKDVGYFCKVFKKNYGVSPKVFRDTP